MTRKLRMTERLIWTYKFLRDELLLPNGREDGLPGQGGK